MINDTPLELFAGVTTLNIVNSLEFMTYPLKLGFRDTVKHNLRLEHRDVKINLIEDEFGRV